MIFQGFGVSEATTAMGELVAVDTESKGPIRGMATQFSSDFMFSEPLFGCPRSPKQA